jgi:hypothetical protein
MKIKTAVKSQILDHKGTTLGSDTLPQWLTVYRDGGELAVEKLREYSGYYCFVGEESGANKQLVTRWAQSISGPALISQQISGRLERTSAGQVLADGDGFKQSLNQVSTAVTTATFSGARKVNDWWVLVRVYDPKKNNQVISEDYTAYVLYTIEKKQLDKLVAAELQNTIDNNKDMSQDERKIYTELIQKITSKGLGV